jgi:hypothetical protein
MNSKRLLWWRGASAALVIAVLVGMAHAQRHGGRRIEGGPGFGGLCGSAVTIGNGLDAIEVMAKPTPEQRPALDELRAIARLNAAAMNAACASGYPSSLPERVAASASRLEAALAGIRRLQPALDKFYAALTDAQKSEANGLLILPGV